MLTEKSKSNTYILSSEIFFYKEVMPEIHQIKTIFSESLKKEAGGDETHVLFVNQPNTNLMIILMNFKDLFST
jgi:hypothetical protein